MLRPKHLAAIIEPKKVGGLGLARWGDGGRVVGKRIGISRNLSAGVQDQRFA